MKTPAALYRVTAAVALSLSVLLMLSACFPSPVEPGKSAADTTVPVSETTAITEVTTASVSETTVVAEETTASVSETTAITEVTTASASETTASAEETTSNGGEIILPKDYF